MDVRTPLMRISTYSFLQLLFVSSTLCVFLITGNISRAETAFQAGDLIFREGTETVSELVMMADSKGSYSHVGMLIGTPGAWQVIHATPEEVTGRGDAVVIDDLDFFISPERSLRYAVYRVEALSKQHEQAVNAALSMLGRPFSIHQGRGTYCTTLVWQAWRDAGIDLQVSYTEIQLPLFSGQYLLPSNLLASPLLHLSESKY